MNEKERVIAVLRQISEDLEDPIYATGTPKEGDVRALIVVLAKFPLDARVKTGGVDGGPITGAQWAITDKRSTIYLTTGGI